MAKIRDIMDSFKEQQAQVAALDRELSAERKEIKKQAFLERRKLTDEETARRKEIAAMRMELAEARKMMGQDIIKNLENSEDIDDLINKISAVNGQLEGNLEKLKKIEGYAKTAEKISANLAKTVKKLVEIHPAL